MVQAWDFVDWSVLNQEWWLSASIDELELSARPRFALLHDGIETIGQLLARNRKELLRIPNFGKKSLREIDEALAQYKPFIGYKQELTDG